MTIYNHILNYPEKYPEITIKVPMTSIGKKEYEIYINDLQKKTSTLVFSIKQRIPTLENGNSYKYTLNTSYFEPFISDINWDSRDLQSYINHILEDVTEYLYNKHIVKENENPFFKSGKLKKKWIEDLLTYETYSLEFTRRYNKILPYLNEEIHDKFYEIIGDNSIVYYDEFKKAYVNTKQYYFYKKHKCTNLTTGESYFPDYYTYAHCYSINDNIYKGRFVAQQYLHSFNIEENTPESSNYYFAYDVSKLKEEDYITIEGKKLPKHFVNLLPDIFSTCPKCNSITFNEHLSEHGCYNCLGITRESIKIQPYNFKVETVLKTYKNKHHISDEKTKFFGVELEYEFKQPKSNISSLIYSRTHLKDFVIFKRDGSLQNGVEIVTAPAELTFHKEKFKTFFEEFQKSKLEARSNTGMHVHINKGNEIIEDGKVISFTNMSYLTVGKLTKFMSDESNKSFLSFIGERESTYAKLGGNHSISTPFLYKEGIERYSALNLKPKHTIEFRLFATPSTYEAFCKNMEFCDAITDFCSSSNTSIKDLTTRHFLDYIYDRTKAYPNLCKYIKSRKEEFQTCV